MKETNMEHYRSEISEILKYGGCFGLKDGKIIQCNHISCELCEFKDFVNGCNAKTIEWMMEEYKPEITLTAREKGFVDVMGYGYVARDEDGCLTWFGGEPSKSASTWDVAMDSNYAVLDCESFRFIAWEDKEPWEIEDLRQLKALEYNPEDVAFKGGGSDE